MKKNIDNATISNQTWELDNISISHNIVNYHSLGTNTSTNENEMVRLHFGLIGNYDFKCKQLIIRYLSRNRISILLNGNYALLKCKIFLTIAV